MRKRTALYLGLSAALILALALVATGTSWPAYAQGAATPTLRPVTDTEVNQVSRNLYCPVCQNVPLEVCETAACADWRQQVRDLLAQGYTEEQVRQYFIQRFGTRTVGLPPDPLSQALTILLPFGVIAVIGIVIGVNMVIWRRKQVPRPEPEPATGTSDPSAAPDDYRARLEAELKERG